MLIKNNVKNNDTSVCDDNLMNNIQDWELTDDQMMDLYVNEKNLFVQEINNLKSDIATKASTDEIIALRQEVNDLRNALNAAILAATHAVTVTVPVTVTDVVHEETLLLAEITHDQENEKQKQKQNQSQFISYAQVQRIEYYFPQLNKESLTKYRDFLSEIQDNDFKKYVLNDEKNKMYNNKLYDELYEIATYLKFYPSINNESSVRDERSSQNSNHRPELLRTYYDSCTGKQKLHPTFFNYIGTFFSWLSNKEKRDVISFNLVMTQTNTDDKRCVDSYKLVYKYTTSKNNHWYRYFIDVNADDHLNEDIEVVTTNNINGFFRKDEKSLPRTVLLTLYRIKKTC